MTALHQGHAEHDHPRWLKLNNPIVEESGEDTFTITTPPDTDIWRPSITADNFTAPYLYLACKTAQFQRVAVTVNAQWKTLYDQGGIAIVFPSRDGSPNKWIKIGIEFTDGAPALGVVATDRFSDWSLSPMDPMSASTARFEAVRSATKMWIYVIIGGHRRALREITWAFLEDRGEVGAEMLVGVYAAKPTRDEGSPEQGLAVTFKDLEISY